MQVQAYLLFSGNCEEALEFYKKTLGAEVQMMVRYKESSLNRLPLWGQVFTLDVRRSRRQLSNSPLAIFGARSSDDRFHSMATS